MNRTTVRLDDPEVVRDLACQAERANFVAKRIGLPAIGSTLVNKHGIKWVVQMHAATPREESLHRWRTGDIQPDQDLYPVIEPKNFSPQLMEFLHAIDRCTTKTFAFFDTMPGRRRDGHVPGGNHIDTVCNPATNILYLDAARVPETVIAHELGHAWVQYVDDCEDFRTMEDASNPQRMRQVSYVQSFVLDLKVNDLLRRKGFDMCPIEEDQAVGVRQLGEALARGYQPEHLREEVFMALVVADEMVERDPGLGHELARFDESLAIIRDTRPPLAKLAETFANSVRKHGYETREGILASIDECLIASFEHANDRIDLERELVAVNPEEPDIDKFPLWLPQLSPKTKATVGKHMARNDISSEWPHELDISITGNARVRFWSPEGDRISYANVNERIGPPNRYSNLPDHVAEQLAMKHLREHKRYLTHGGPPHTMQDLHPHLQPQPPQAPVPPTPFPPTYRGLPFGHAHGNPQPPSPCGHQPPQPHGPPNFDDFLPPGFRPPRPYMAGTGRFLTAARPAEAACGRTSLRACLVR